MIELETLTIKNFTVINNVTLHFRDSIFHVIHGDNGSGKSSVVHALAVALFEYKKGDSFKDYVQKGKSRAEIYLKAKFRGEPLLLDVIINSAENKSPLERTLTYKNVIYKNSEVSVFLKENLDLSILENIMFSLQHSTNNFSELSPSQRRDLFKNIFNISFEEELNRISASEEVLKTSLQEYELLFSLLKNKKFERLSLMREWPEEKFLQTKLQISELENKIHELYEYVAQKEKYDQKIKLQKKLLELEKDLSTKVDEIQKQEKSLVEYESFFSLQEKTISNFKYLYEKAEVLKQIFEKKMKEVSLNEVELKTLITLKEQEIKDHESGKCPRCKRPFSEKDTHNVQSELQLLKNSLSDTQAKLNFFSSKFNFYNGKLKEHKKKQEEEQTKFSSKKKEYSDVLQRIEFEKKSLEREQQLYEETKKDYDVITLSSDFVVNENYDFDLELEKIKNDKEALTKELHYHQSIRDKNSFAREQNAKIDQEEKENQKQLEDLSKKINETKQFIADHQEAARILSVDFSNYIILNICRSIEDFINDFIDSVRPDLKVKLVRTKKGVELFYSTKGSMSDSKDEWSSVKMSSGFEGQLINLAFKIALAKAYNIRTLLLDEIDSAYNPSNTHRLFNIVAKITDFDLIIVITHKDDVKSILREEVSSITTYYVSRGEYEIV